MSRSDFVHGHHAVRSSLKYDPTSAICAYVETRRGDKRMGETLDILRKKGIPTEQVDKKQLDQMSGGEAHQGVVLEITGQKPKTEQDLQTMLDGLSEPPFLLILDGVTDPHNLGACLRSADAAGVHGVVCPKDRAVGLTSVVHKVASGASRTVPFYQVTNLSRTMDQLKEQGIWIVGTAGETDVSVYQQDLKGALAVVMGAEEKGMRQQTRKQCDFLVKIPMVGQVESLNVSVATGVVLFEALRQRASGA